MEPAKRITKSTAEKIIENLFGEKPLYVSQINNGNFNKVYRAIMRGEDLIVRLSTEPDKINIFLKEQWCTNKTRELGIPTPEVLEVHNIPYPYMVSKEIPGLPGNHYGADKSNIYYEMGKYLKQINSIKTNGYGKVFDWSNNQLSRNPTWEDYLDRELKIHEIFELFEKHKILTHDNLKKFIYIFDEIRDWKFTPTLAHGDYLLKNVMVSKEGSINGIIDWETAISYRAPYWEFSKTIYFLNNEEDKNSFLEGYGMTPKKLNEIMKYVEAINLSRYGGHVKWALNEKMDAEVEKQRVELNKILDKY